MHILDTVTEVFPKSSFGDRLQQAFSRIFACKEEEAEAAAVICLLYISHRKAEFPLEKLSSCIYNIEENIQRIYFDCNKYERITALIPEEDYRETVLLNRHSQTVTYEITKDDLIEAFDFYTNR